MFACISPISPGSSFTACRYSNSFIWRSWFHALPAHFAAKRKDIPTILHSDDSAVNMTRAAYFARMVLAIAGRHQVSVGRYIAVPGTEAKENQFVSGYRSWNVGGQGRCY
jgi:hypothetical protein